MKIDSLSLRYSYKVLGNVVSALVNLVVLAFVPKALGPAQYGLFIYLQQIFGQIVSLLDLSTSGAIFVKLSANNNRLELLKWMAIYLSLIFVVLIIISFVFGLIVSSTSEPKIIGHHLVFLGALLAFSTYLATCVSGILDALAETVLLEKVKLSVKLFMLVCLVYVLYFEEITLTLYFIYQIAFFIFVVAMGSIAFLIKAPKDFLSGIRSMSVEYKPLSREIYIFASPLVIHTVVGGIVVIFDIWLLKNTANTDQVGVYGAALAISQVPMFLVSPMIPLLTREFSALAQKERFSEMSRLFDSLVTPCYVIVTFICICGVFYSEMTLTFLGEKYAFGLTAITVVMIYPILQTMTQISMVILLSVGDTSHVRTITIYGAIFGLPLSLIFLYVYGYGAVGLIIKILAVNLLVVNMLLFRVSKIIGKSYKSMLALQLQPIFFISITVMMGKFATSDLFDNFIFNSILGGLISFFLLCSMAFIVPHWLALKNFSIIKVIKKLKF